MQLPDMLYHATYRPLLASIQKKGLGGVGCSKNWQDSLPGVVYLALEPGVAESYAESSDEVPEDWLDEIIILAVQTSCLDVAQLRLDTNVQDNEGDTVQFEGVIPWSSLALNNKPIASRPGF